MKKFKKNNIISFPNEITLEEKEIEAILFAAEEPLDIDSIRAKITKDKNLLKSLTKLQNHYSKRGINLVCISNKWSFRTSDKLSDLMSQKKSVQKKLSRAAIETLSITGFVFGIFLFSIFNKSVSQIIDNSRFGCCSTIRRRIFPIYP